MNDMNFLKNMWYKLAHKKIDVAFALSYFIFYNIFTLQLLGSGESVRKVFIFKMTLLGNTKSKL